MNSLCDYELLFFFRILNLRPTKKIVKKVDKILDTRSRIIFFMWFMDPRDQCSLHPQNICTNKIHLKGSLLASSTTKPDPESVERIELVSFQ